MFRKNLRQTLEKTLEDTPNEAIENALNIIKTEKEETEIYIKLKKKYE